MTIPRTVGELRVSIEGGRPVIHGPTAAPPGSDEEEVLVEANVGMLRDWVRFDDFGRYRPLASALTLRTGWRLECEVDEGLTLDEAIAIVYPLALEHAAHYAAGTLGVVSLEETLARQTGRYAVARELSGEGRVIAQEVLCARCVREPVWSERDVKPPPGAIPCPEPCSVMVSLCREAAPWERERPAGAVVDHEVDWAAFDTAGNEVREAYLARASDPVTPLEGGII